MPTVRHSVANGNRQITIIYEENKIAESKDRVNKVWEEIKNWIKNNVGENAPERNVLNAQLDQPEKIVQGIRDEYCSKKYSEVAEILQQSGITVEFQYNGQTVSCWKTKEIV